MQIVALVFGLLFLALPLQAEESPRICSESKGSAAKILSVMAAVPTPPFFALEGRPGAMVMSQELFAAVLGTAPQSIVLNDTEELRMVPHTLSGSALLLVLRQVQDWTELKARRVSRVAKDQNLTISLLWLGEGEVPTELRSLIQETAGKTWRLSELESRIEDYVCANRPS